jgi:hypothetical protein
LIYGLKTILETKKNKFDYMNKTNANHFKTFEIKSLWLAPLFPPKDYVGSNFIMAKVVTFNGGKRGQMQKQKTFKRPNLNLIFLPTLFSKILSLHPSFNYENREKIISL